MSTFRDSVVVFIKLSQVDHKIVLYQAILYQLKPQQQANCISLLAFATFTITSVQTNTNVELLQVLKRREKKESVKIHVSAFSVEYLYFREKWLGFLNIFISGWPIFENSFGFQSAMIGSDYLSGLSKTGTYCMLLEL